MSPRAPIERLALSPPETEMGRIQQALLRLLRGPKHAQAPGGDGLPTSSRFLFYELVQMGVLDKDSGKKRPDGIVSEALIRLRLLNLIPWEWIVDETRDLTEWNVYPTILAGVLERLNNVRLDPWGTQYPPMILTESRSLAGVLRNLAFQFLVPIAPTNGQVHGFLRTTVGKALHEDQEVLYLGDLDEVGNDIEANTRKILEEMVGALTWTRLALTIEQVRTYRIPRKMKTDKRDDSRSAAYETEALSQTVIQDLLRAALRRRLPEPLARVQARENDPTGEDPAPTGRDVIFLAVRRRSDVEFSSCTDRAAWYKAPPDPLPLGRF